MTNSKILVFLLVALFSCEPDPNLSRLDLGYGYIPLNVGNSITYNVREIQWNDFTNSVDTFYYQIQEKVESEFLDLEDRPSFRVVNYEILNGSKKLNYVYTNTKSARRFETLIDNQRIVNLVFPAVQNLEWNGNAFISDEETFRYSRIDFDTSINGLSFDSTLTVKQFSYDDGIIDRRTSEEKYAKGVGLVYKKWEFIKYNNFELDSGVSLTYTISDYSIQ